MNGLLSRGSLRDIEFIPPSIADERDTWACACCERVLHDDTKLNDDMLCADCAEEKLLADE